MKRVCSIVRLLEVVLKEDFSLEIGLVDVEWASERACQPRKLNQHFFLFLFLLIFRDVRFQIQRNPIQFSSLV